MIIASLNNNFLFKNLSSKEHAHLIENMFYCQVAVGEFVFKQNDDAQSFFILKSGQVHVIINDRIKKTLGPGASFGELALLYNSPRSASIKVCEDCELFGINRKTFKEVLRTLNNQEQDEILNCLSSIDFLKNLHDNRVDVELSHQQQLHP